MVEDYEPKPMTAQKKLILFGIVIFLLWFFGGHIIDRYHTCRAFFGTAEACIKIAFS